MGKFPRTPKVELKFHKLHEANQWGGYDCSAILDPEDSEHKEFIDKILKKEEALLQTIPPVKHDKFVSVLKPETTKEGEETGRLLLKLSSKFAPTFVDKTGKVMAPIKLLFYPEVLLYFQMNQRKDSKGVGFKMYAVAVQVINPGKTEDDLKTGFDASKIDFDTFDEGYEAGTGVDSGEFTEGADF